MKKILTEAAEVGNPTARAILFRTRMKDAPFYPNSAWITTFIGGSYEFLSQPGVRNLDARTLFFYYATGITPAMAMKMVGIGSQYVPEDYVGCPALREIAFERRAFFRRFDADWRKVGAAWEPTAIPGQTRHPDSSQGGSFRSTALHPIQQA
jgi:hypothetical protein